MTTPTRPLPPVPPGPPPPYDRRRGSAGRPPPSTGREGRGWLGVAAAILAAGLVGALVTALAFVLAGDDDPTPTTAPTGGTATPSAPATTAPATTAPATATPGPSPSPSAVRPAPFLNESLWPFASPAAAVTWQIARGDRHQPWRLDPSLTAVSFARDYLGFTEIDTATSRVVRGDQAWIGVGSTRPEGRFTAAVLHLTRIGATGRYATSRPWEVVGSRDADLTLTTPHYGAVVHSPLTVGGRITGVDESLHVQLRTLGGPVLGEVRGIPAGGVGQPWQAKLEFADGRGRVATVAVSTGGHLLEVERFAITAVRISSTG
jgi:hypothetical protein